MTRFARWAAGLALLYGPIGWSCWTTEPTTIMAAAMTAASLAAATLHASWVVGMEGD